MSFPIYHLRGTPYRDDILYLDAAGSGQTGKTFTFKLAKNASTATATGVTATEVNASSNPGLYSILCDQVTSFVTADGAYSLTTTDAANPARVWEQTIIVNATGAPLSAGVSFTATAANGRAMAGGNPLPNATVIITNAGGSILAVFTTSSTGVWGPAYFTADGVYTITVQAAGYTSATGTITVSGSGTIAVGPLADLTLVAATTNPLSASELWAYFTRQARDVSGGKADVERKQGVQEALEMLAKECQWNWLLRRAFFQLRGKVAVTATLTNGSAIVTTTGTDTFPTWTVEGRAFMQSQVIDILSLDSTTQMTLKTVWMQPTMTVTVTIFKDEYALPDNTLWFHQLIPYQRWAWGGTPESQEVFFQRQSAMMYGQQFPSCWSVFSGKLGLYPYPSADAVLAYTYYIQPTQLNTGTDIADWDPAQVEVLHRAIDVQVVNRYGSCAGGEAGEIMGRYKTALARARTTDREPTSAGNALEETSVFDARMGRTWRQRPRG